MSAKISGDDVAAKWHLLDAAKSEITEIERQTEEAKNKVGKPLKLYKPSQSPLKKFVLTSSITASNKLSNRVFDIRFHEVPEMS